MDQPHVRTQPRDVFLYLLTVIMLYVSVWRFIALLFEYINVSLPDPLITYLEGSYSDIRTSMSALFIVFPIYIGLTWYLRKDMIAHPEKRGMGLRKWLLNLTLFLTAIAIIADLVTLINTFLNGELTLRFVLKVVAVLVVAAGVFSYYLWDLRRETLPTSKPSTALAVLVSGIMLCSIVGGFFIIGSPATQRQRRFDERRVNDLQMIQGEIINYWVQKSSLPPALDALQNDISGFAQPTDPLTSQPYEYRMAGSLGFELCANFAFASKNSSADHGYPYPRAPYPLYSQNWEHEAGRACFTRTIDPQIYRPQPVKY